MSLMMKIFTTIKYTKVTTKFGFIDSFFNVIVFLTFWLLGGFGWLDQIVTNLGLGPIVSGLMVYSSFLRAYSGFLLNFMKLSKLRQNSVLIIQL